MITSGDLEIKKLGPCEIESPLRRLLGKGELSPGFQTDNDKTLFEPVLPSVKPLIQKNEIPPAAEIAGPREKIYFDPSRSAAAIVSCGGLCPGINDVIRALVMELHYRYGVKKILGIRYGYQGFITKFGYKPIELTPDLVDHIHVMGGTILGTSRGRQSVEEIVDFLVNNRINILFTIGGDGTQRGALEISNCAQNRGLKISVIGIPKTVDNDILYIDNTFGFATAFSEAAKHILSAHNEAKSAPNGIGLVKLMGRNSGFIACFAALGMTDVNFVLIPEVPFKLEGNNGFLNVLRKRLESRSHAVIVVAEGAGQDLFKQGSVESDASGNPKLNDIGLFLKNKLTEYFRSINVEINLKYIDPSYIIRSIPANGFDKVYCVRLGQTAVHAAMSGRTEMVVGAHHSYLVHLPMDLISKGRQHINPNGLWWEAVISSTGQPTRFE